MECLCEYRVFLICNVGAAGSTEVKHARRVGGPSGVRKIASHKTAHVLSQRDAEFARALPGGLVNLRVQSNLGTRHHDGTIITQIVPVETRIRVFWIRMRKDVLPVRVQT